MKRLNNKQNLQFFDDTADSGSIKNAKRAREHNVLYAKQPNLVYKRGSIPHNRMVEILSGHLVSRRAFHFGQYKSTKNKSGLHINDLMGWEPQISEILELVPNGRLYKMPLRKAFLSVLKEFPESSPYYETKASMPHDLVADSCATMLKAVAQHFRFCVFVFAPCPSLAVCFVRVAFVLPLLPRVTFVSFPGHAVRHSQTRQAQEQGAR